jgi:hypothetical protein
LRRIQRRRSQNRRSREVAEEEKPLTGGGMELKTCSALESEDEKKRSVPRIHVHDPGDSLA